LHLGAALYLLLSNQLHYRIIQFSGSEWIPSTPFDASLLTPEPPHGGSFFFSSGLHIFLRCGVATKGAEQASRLEEWPQQPPRAPPARPPLSIRHCRDLARMSFKRKLQIGRRCA
jgi:hypothetical protein